MLTVDNTRKYKGKPLKDRIPFRTGASPTNPTDNQLVYRYLQTFQPLPWQLPFMRDFTSETVLLTGSQGGGKSRAAAEKIHAFCLNYPGAQALVMRKVEDNVIASAWKMLKKRVIGQDPRVKFNKAEMVAEYLNGSTIYFAGMFNKAQREAIRSIGEGTIDICWIEEAHEMDEKDYEETIGRIRGDVAGWNQLILSTNPDSPLHWINLRLIIGEQATVYYSSARDNPNNSENYLKRQEEMTGINYLRLVKGLWVQATGAIHDTFVDNYVLKDRDRGVGNVTEDAEYIDGLPVWIFADDGYAGKVDETSQKKGLKRFTRDSHPRVFLLAQFRSDGGINVFAESYEVKLLVPAHLEIVDKMCKKNGWAKPRNAVYDSASPSLGKALQLWGCRNTYPGTKDIEDSVKILRESFAPDANDWRHVHIHPRCKLLRFELVTWAYDENGRFGKYFDNGPDALRYGRYWQYDPKNEPATTEVDSTDEKLLELMDRIDQEWEKHFDSVGLMV